MLPVEEARLRPLRSSRRCVRHARSTNESGSIDIISTSFATTTSGQKGAASNCRAFTRYELSLWQRSGHEVASARVAGGTGVGSAVRQFEFAVPSWSTPSYD